MATHAGQNGDVIQFLDHATTIQGVNHIAGLQIDDLEAATRFSAFFGEGVVEGES